MSNLKDKVVVITGGSKGFGLASAEALLAQEAKVALISRSQESLDKAKVDLDGGDNIFVFACDVADSASVDKAFSAINDHFGYVDALINNAGLAKVGHLSELIDEEVRLQLDTNILGTIFCCRAALPFLKVSADTQRNPRILNISSASAHHHDEMAHLSIYAASKAAVERYSRDLRREVEKDFIGVSIIRPGAALDTEFGFGLDMEKLKDALVSWHDQGPNIYEGMESKDVAQAVVYCLQSPTGVSVDLLEVRPNKRTAKPLLS